MRILTISDPTVPKLARTVDISWRRTGSAKQDSSIVYGLVCIPVTHSACTTSPYRQLADARLYRYDEEQSLLRVQNVRRTRSRFEEVS